MKNRKRSYLGSGLSRVVYDLRNGYVLKIAKANKTGVASNRTEVILYQSALKEVKKYLAKISDYDAKYRWLVMKKYNRPFPNTPEYRRKLKKLVETLRRHGIYPSKRMLRNGQPPPVNMRFKHLRLKRNKQIVVIDYGGFQVKRTHAP